MPELNPGDLDTLPGVLGREATPPRAVLQVGRAVKKARRRAAVQDTLDVILLLCVDWFFLSWSSARIPFLSRDTSLDALLIANFLLLTWLLLARAYPRWKARRIATTWCAAEREELARAHSRRSTR